MKKDAGLIQVSSRCLLPESGGITHEIKIHRKATEFCVGFPSCLRQFGRIRNSKDLRFI